jgi:transcriptional regulator with GAF, ATPase, and Fis domain
MASNALQIPRTDDPRLADNVSIRSQSDLFRWLVSGDKFTNPESQAGRGEHAIAAEARNTGRCDALVQLFRALRHSDSVAGLTSVLAAEASQLIEVDFIGVSRYDDATRTVEWHVAIPGAEVESGTIETAAAETITEWIYQNQLPLVIPALDCQTRLQSKILQRLPEGIQSLCAVPLTCAQHKLGVLFVGSMAKDVYGEEEIHLLSLVATQVCSAIENHLAHGQIAELKGKLEQRSLAVEDEEESRQLHGFEEIVGQSATLRNVLMQIETVAPTDCTVLICGETGTGKELIARAIHDRSSRHAASFVKLNCAAIPTGLLESELFGHEKGAFTGAISQRIGRFELANHGTMFLDEIGEIPLELQPKLLRVLQEREFERLGNSRTLHTDTRLVAATNRDLEQMVEENRFRADLFYRLNVFPIRIPALRERPEDIPLLVNHFTEQYARRMNKQIDSIASETMKALCTYHWPGNIRELQNVIERAVVMTRGSELQVLVSDFKRRPGSNADSSCSGTLEEAERAHILATLKQTEWVIAGPNGAAARLGLHRSTLQFRMKKLGINVVRVAKQ